MKGEVFFSKKVQLNWNNSISSSLQVQYDDAEDMVSILKFLDSTDPIFDAVEGKVSKWVEEGKERHIEVAFKRVRELVTK